VTKGKKMIDTLSQLTVPRVLQGILTLTKIVILTIVALYLVNLAAKTIDKRLIVPTEDSDRRKRLEALREACVAVESYKGQTFQSDKA
jgi:hypothetical protein